jgi:hypothetical protein
MRCHNDMEGFGYGQGGEDLDQQLQEKLRLIEN